MMSQPKRDLSLGGSSTKDKCPAERTGMYVGLSLNNVPCSFICSTSIFMEYLLNEC